MSVSAAVAAGRAAILPLLRDRCNVVTPAKGTGDGRFGWAAGTPTTTYTSIPCAVQPRSTQGIEETVQQRLQGRAFFSIRLEATRTVTMGQQIVCNGATYEVIGDPLTGTNGLTLVVPCARNTP